MRIKSQETKKIESEDDILTVRTSIKRIVSLLNFSLTNQTKIVTATSELARNTLEHGKGGRCTMLIVDHNDRVGVKLVFEDNGPGIESIPRAMEDGFTTCGGMGLGLGGCRRLMDDFEIASKPGEGTTVSITKWLND